jgi:hypothetical protein
MYPHVSVWIHVGPCGSTWPCMLLWIHVDPHRSMWIHMDPCGSMWSCMLLWIHMDPHGSTWIHVDPCGLAPSCIHMESCGPTCAHNPGGLEMWAANAHCRPPTTQIQSPCPGSCIAPASPTPARVMQLSLSCCGLVGGAQARDCNLSADRHTRHVSLSQLHHCHAQKTARKELKLHSILVLLTPCASELQQ